MSSVPPGWYPDPWVGPQAVRYWNGLLWTDQAAVRAATPAVREPQPTLPFPVAIGALLSVAVPLTISKWVFAGVADGMLDLLLSAALAYGPGLVFWRYASRRWGTGSLRADVGLKARWVDSGWGPLTCVSCFASNAIMFALIKSFDIPFESNLDPPGDADTGHGYNVPLIIVAIVVIVVVAPVVEEIIFRGLVQRGFVSVMPFYVAIGLQGVLFGFAHFDPDRGTGNIGLVIMLSAVGVVLGGSSYLVRRLAPNMIAHAMFNGLAITVVLLR